ncbi:phage tail tape measure protein [Ectopseudomonas guguanensis]|uniref:phage tail tape measure protein n=1 Tax=Ectopseudomonas guguanensis TaxID=1198456 RepID=UPI002860858F|nr:phage tail tape measure protein [Pseudomonas guguanensis]MDR8014095.1 phage tail tape measure protein [Pseudomonas guguanensis]
MARDLKLQVVLQGLNRASKPFREAGRSAIGLGRDLKATRTELKGLQAQQSDISSFRALKGQTEQTGKALEAARQKVKDLRIAHVANTAELRKNQAAQRAAIREATALKAAHNRQQAELQGLRGKLNAAGISTRNLGQHERDLKARITATNQAMAQQEARLKRVTAQQQRLARAKQQYEKTQALAGSMAATGAGGLATGSGILYSGARLLAPGLDFDASMSQVQALTKQENGSDALKALRNQARDLGASTQFTAVQAADAQGFLAMAGFKVDVIMASMPGMLALAKAGRADLADTADIASNILSGLGMQANEMGRLGDVLTATFGNSNTNLQMLGETMKYAAPIAKTYAVDLETVSAMAGKLGDAGIQGSMGGTALSAIMNRLAAPPKAAAKALEALGITTADAAGNMRPMPDILKEVYDKTKALGTATRGGYLKAIAGDEAVKGMSYLVDQAGSGALQSFIADLRQAGGSAERVSRVMGDNLRGDLDALSSAWANLGIELQTQQNGPLRGITQGITKVIGSVKTWVAENPKLASQLVKTAAGLGIVMAGMGGLTLAMASILGPFAMVRYGLMLFGIRGAGLASTLFSLGKVALPLVATGLKALAVAAMANPILAIITGIALGAALIYSNWDRVGPYFAGLWGELKAGFSGGLKGIAATILNFSPLGLFHRALAGVLSYFGVDIPARFTDFGGMLIDGLVNGITAGLGKIKSAITGAADSSIGWFKQKLGIHSPSRVFAELGGYTMQGYGQGLLAEQRNPLGALQRIGDNLVRAGSQTIGGQVAFDTRAPLAAAGTGRNAGRPVVVEGDTIRITIQGGGDVAATRRMLEQLLGERERAKAARMRSALYDQD